MLVARDKGLGWSWPCCSCTNLQMLEMHVFSCSVSEPRAEEIGDRNLFCWPRHFTDVSFVHIHCGVHSHLHGIKCMRGVYVLINSSLC